MSLSVTFENDEVWALNNIEVNNKATIKDVEDEGVVLELDDPLLNFDDLHI